MTVTERHFDVPADRLFAVLANPDSYPAWLVGTRKIRAVSPRWPEPGSDFKHMVGFGPIAIPDTTTVRAVRPPHLLEMLVRARPAIEAVVRFEVTPSGPTSCHLTMIETPVGPYRLIAPIAQPLIRARNERSLHRLAGVVDAAQAADL